ncbi:hypothetical protein Cs7R123_42240 [Catellatospora sp. TT07R-123]|nr:hypothetical protein Cs7R123_42240 [Catellatospora sp. TT07R-123]
MLAVVLVLTAACGGSSDDGSAAAPGPAASSGPAGMAGTFDNVTYGPNAVVVDAGAVASGLRAEDGKVFRFAAGTKGIDKLAPGKTVLFGGKAVRKVAAVRTEGDQVVVETADTTLNELVDTGTVGWTVPVAWAGLSEKDYKAVRLSDGTTTRVADVSLVRQAGDGPSVTNKWTIGGVEVTLKLTPKATRLDVELEASRANAKVTASGWVSNFTNETRMEFDHGAGRSITSNIRKLSAEMEVTWAAVGRSGTGLDTDIARLSFPFEAPIPFVVGGIPFTLKVKSAIRIVPALRENSSSGGSFKVTYDADQGFAKSGSPLLTGTSDLRTAEAVLGAKETVTAGYLPVGFGWGWEFPRLELATLGIGTFAFITLDTYVAGEFTPGTTLTADIPPCQRASATLHAIAGYKLELLGFATLKDQTTLWEKKIEKFKDDEPCTLTGK